MSARTVIEPAIPQPGIGAISRADDQACVPSQTVATTRGHYEQQLPKTGRCLEAEPSPMFLSLKRQLRMAETVSRSSAKESVMRRTAKADHAHVAVVDAVEQPRRILVPPATNR